MCFAQEKQENIISKPTVRAVISNPSIARIYRAEHVDGISTKMLPQIVFETALFY